MKRDSIDLGKVKISRLFRTYLFPTLMGMLALCAVTATDGIFVGRFLGSDSLAAVNICIAPTMLLAGIGLMLGVGASVVASIHLAADNEHAARLNITQSLVCGTVIALLFLILTLASPATTAHLLGSSDSLLPLTLEYMPWIFTACLFQIWGAIGLFVVRLDGSPKYAMWCNVLPGLLNVILDWLFIVRCDMGVGGAAVASCLSCLAGAMMIIVYVVFLAHRLTLIRIRTTIKSLRLTLRNIGYQCKIGISALLGEATMGVLMLLGNLMFMKYIGDDGVGAFSIACYYCPFAFMIGNAIAQSAQPIISYNYGLGDHRRVVSTERLAIFSALICGVIVTFAFIFFPSAMIGLFLSGSSPTVAIAKEGFPVFASAFIFFIFNLTAIGYFQSVENVIAAIVFALLRGVIFLIPSFILLPAILGTPGIWIALGVSEFLTTICIATYYFLIRRREQKQICVSCKI